MNEFFQFALSSKVDGNILHLRECSIKATCLQRFCVNFSWSQRILDRRGDIKYEAYHRKSWTLVRFQESSIDSFPLPPPLHPSFYIILDRSDLWRARRRDEIFTRSAKKEKYVSEPHLRRNLFLERKEDVESERKISIIIREIDWSREREERGKSIYIYMHVDDKAAFLFF